LKFQVGDRVRAIGYWYLGREGTVVSVKGVWILVVVDRSGPVFFWTAT
jgi:hypothetical protein